MGIVVVFDQQMSTFSPDRVEVAAAHLNRTLGGGLLRPPVRTAGDEMQAVIGDPESLADVVEFCLRDGGWWLGVGLGDIELLGKTTRESRGPAFAAARRAVELAKRQRRRPIAVCGDPPDIAERLQGMCDVLAYLTEHRTERQWEVIDAARDSGSGSNAARTLRITPQSANEALRAAGFSEQQATKAEIGFLALEAERRSVQADAR